MCSLDSARPAGVSSHVTPRLLALSALAFMVWSGLSLSAHAQDAQVEFSVTTSAQPLRSGEHLTLHLDAKIPAGYHLYSMTRIEGPKALKVRIPKLLIPQGPWRAPTPHKKYDPLFKVETETYQEQVRHSRNFKLRPPPNALGDLDLSITVSGLFCNEQRCIPIKHKLPLRLTLESGEVRSCLLYTSPSPRD